MFCRKHQVGVAYVADLLLRTERHGYHGLQKKFSVKADLRRFEVPLIEFCGFDVQLFLKIIKLSLVYKLSV